MPTDVELDGNGQLMFTERGATRERIINGGILNDVAGPGASTSEGDGHRATSAMIGFDFSVALPHGLAARAVSNGYDVFIVAPGDHNARS